MRADKTHIHNAAGEVDPHDPPVFVARDVKNNPSLFPVSGTQSAFLKATKPIHYPSLTGSKKLPDGIEHFAGAWNCVEKFVQTVRDHAGTGKTLITTQGKNRAPDVSSAGQSIAFYLN
ncbi:hypothetical protein [Hoeflea sp.]|uniref:hypothetical protein n=1 Tax=Hoeflea sp. TaxID=1940281 RepID=UPI0025C269CA|nr:hypothetical protein [Hoeflea sp.]